MVPLRVLTLLFTGMQNPAVLVLEPIEEPIEGKSRVIPIWIGGAEAMQLGVSIEHVKLPRPMTHDLFLDAITNLDACVDHVSIVDVQGQTFFAKLVLRSRGRLIELDARPTDALSLALREDAPILIEENVLKQASYPYIFKGEKQRETELTEFRDFISELSPEDFNDLSMFDMPNSPSDLMDLSEKDRQDAADDDKGGGEDGGKRGGENPEKGSDESPQEGGLDATGSDS